MACNIDAGLSEKLWGARLGVITSDIFAGWIPLPVAWSRRPVRKPVGEHTLSDVNVSEGVMGQQNEAATVHEGTYH